MKVSFIEKIKRSFEDYTGVVDFESVYIGNDTFQNLYTNYEYTNFIENFISGSVGEVFQPDTIFIVGSLNLNQKEKLKKMYDSLKGKRKYVIHLRGSIRDQLASKSYFIEEELSDILPVDLTYSKYPYDLEEITKLVTELKRSH